MQRRTAWGWAAAATVTALVVGASVVWPGLDAREAAPENPNVWVMQADGLRYGRVNTAIGELDTVRSVSNPSRVVSGETGSFVFADSDSKVLPIDDATPIDVDAGALENATTAPGTVRETVTAGDFVAYRTDAGAVYAGRLSSGTSVRVTPDSDDDADQYVSAAIAVDDEGMLYSYSAGDASVLRFDIRTAAVRSVEPLAAEIDAPAVTADGDQWIVVDTATGWYWSRDNADGTASGLSGTLAVSAPDTHGEGAYLADEDSLVRLDAAGAAPEELFSGGTPGAPARPVSLDGEVYAAWLPEGAGPGTLWSSAGGEQALDYGSRELPTQRRPQFSFAPGRDRTDTLVLTDARSGWVWRVNDARLLPSSQDWSLEARSQQTSTGSENDDPAVIDPRPPVAVADAFGVRPGALVSLPVLLNDHDPNTDVLTIDPESVTGLDPGFGVVADTDDRQRLAVRVAPDADGTAAFRYRVSDGSTDDGLLSDWASVTLTVADEDENSAPQWCVAECQQQWPEPTVPRGGTATVSVLSDWVDPEGDSLLLVSASSDDGGTVATTPAGEIVYQHRDGGGEAPAAANLQVTVADARGAESTRALTIRVVDDPQPVLTSFAVVQTVGSRLTVDVAPHVTGVAGETTVTDARVLDDAAAEATVVAGTTRFDFSAPDAGVYRVGLTVAVDGVETEGFVRITLLESDAPAQLSTAPVVAFVRPQSDATIDVFAAVSNPTGRVLLLSDPVATPAAGASLSVDAVAQSQLRVSGTTADGAAGILGTVAYRVSDGTTDEGSSVEGQATVYLLPPAPAEPPIAVDDAVVARAGTQLDVAVLANDIAATGTTPRLAADSIRSSTDEALAFASGDRLRYLAPETPGVYTVDYQVFSPGTPSERDEATVRIRVPDDGSNRPPLPTALSGRVLSGLTASIEFDSSGVDPDGDAVRLDSIVSQPEVGSAAISADGSSIEYTSVPGDRGQREVRFRVVDEFGATGEAVARIGVLGDDTDPSPVTYTDYIHVQAGAGNVIRVQPLDNDLDPTDGTLTLDAVVPDAPAQNLDGSPNPEFARLEGRIRDVEGGVVTIEAGEQPQTMAFFYDVTSSSKNTARGLIVVDVVSDSVPDYPIVEDTVLTGEDREDFTHGVDVLSGKVQWVGGDPRQLRIRLWGEPEGVSVSGSRVRGELTDQAQLIPFAVTGTVAGEQVTTYAFVRVPGEAEAALTLREGLEPLRVNEGEAGSFDVDDVVAAPASADLEISSEVSTSGARPDAQCVLTGRAVEYRAGEGAPWTDACVISVRLAGQNDWTVLSVPVAVDAREPQPVLSPASVTVSPGATVTYDLADLTSWPASTPGGSLEYAVDGTPRAFDVSQEGAVLTITAADTAPVGAVEGVTVAVVDREGVSPARLSLRVGAAPSTLPQGGSTSLTCSQAAGSSCQTAALGLPGEVNPLPETPLQVVDVRMIGSCPGVGFSLGDNGAVRADWVEDAPGSRCTASVSLRDAQGRYTAPDREATIAFALQGYPAAPASVRQRAFADGTVELSVEPGGARRSSPALSGFEVRSGGEVVGECDADGRCDPISAPNGEQRTYEVFAVNEVGLSREAVTTVAWAYAAPRPPGDVRTAPVVTSGDGGVISLEITGIDAAATDELEIRSPAGETLRVPVAERQTRVTVASYRVGSNTPVPVTITPQSRFSAPPAGDPPAISSKTINAGGIGRPLDVSLTLTSRAAAGDTAVVDAVAQAESGGAGSTLRYGIVREGRACRATSATPTAQFDGLEGGRSYTFEVCVESVVGSTVYGRATATADVRAAQSEAPPTGYRFVVNPEPRVNGQRADWIITDAPTSPAPVPAENTVAFSGLPSTIFDADPGIQVRYEHTAGWWASEWGNVLPAPGSAPYQVQAQWGVDACVPGSRLQPMGTSTANAAVITFDEAKIRYLDADGRRLPTGPDAWVVPAGAVQVIDMSVRVDWPAWNLDAAEATFSATCAPASAPANQAPGG